MTGTLCDLYELTMAVSYQQRGMTDPATFSLFARALPADRGFLVVGGVDDAIDWITGLRFTPDDLSDLRHLGFSRADVDRLADITFTGDIWVVPDGRAVTAHEPILEVTAPLPEAQIVETLALNQITYQTAIATKAARARCAVRDRIELVDFAFRRTHGIEAAMAVAKLSAMVGFVGTSNVAAARRFGLRAVGTMAHSYVEAFPTEREAFAAFAHDFPERSTFLVDTYDTIGGVAEAISVIGDLGLVHNVGIRLDSGDLASLAIEARKMLDAAGLNHVRIFASGGLDEYELEQFADAGVPIDAVGVGTKMGVAADAPYLDTAYKLVSYGGRPVRKVSPGKATMPGAKQIYRRPGMHDDLITRRDEVIVAGVEPEPLLTRVVHRGSRLEPPGTLDTARQRFEKDLAELPKDARRLRDPNPLRARFSAGLQQLADEADRQRRTPTPVAKP